MKHIKHIGIYVEDIELEKKFFMSCFSMIPIVVNLEDEGELYDTLLNTEHAKVKITKLITEYGKKTGIGEMVELIQVLCSTRERKKKRNLTDFGLSHVSMQVNDIENVLKLVVNNKGKISTKIFQIGERKCCFIEDPEGNAIELIE